MNLNVSAQSSQRGSAATEDLTTDLTDGTDETVTGVDQAYRVRRSLAAVGHVSSPGGHS
jgi:hypothetical protein